MTLKTVAVSLKIPDNAAYTALTALRRLGVNADRIERSDIWQFDDNGYTDLAARFEANETLFNPNKHQLRIRESARPLEGEVWIETLDAGEVPVRMTGVTHARRYTGWRLFTGGKTPVAHAVVAEAAAKLLCNPAIERAIFE